MDIFKIAWILLIIDGWNNTLCQLYLVNGVLIQNPNNVCVDGDKYGYKDNQTSYIDQGNGDIYYNTAILWYREGYGMFDCCGLIKEIQVMVNTYDFISFQVWRPASPITTSAAFLFRHIAEVNPHTEQTISIDRSLQLPVRPGDALGWANDAMETIKYGIDPAIEPDGEYLFDDISNYGYGSNPFSLIPTTWWVHGNAQTFEDYGTNIKDLIWGVRAVVSPGIEASFDELPLSTAAYSSYGVGDIIHTLTMSGPNPLELSSYVTVAITVNPSDTGGYFVWDTSTMELKVGSSLTGAVHSSPFVITFLVSDGCHTDTTGTLDVYVFDDLSLPVCSSGQQVAIPPSFVWDQTFTESAPAEVAMTDPRWRVPFTGMIEAVQLCVTSAPVEFEIQTWSIHDLNARELILIDFHRFTVSVTGCPATIYNIPIADKISVTADQVIGWRLITGELAYTESSHLPATTSFLWANQTSEDLPEDYYIAGSPFSFEYSGGSELDSQRDYGVRVYVGPGESPTVTGLESSIYVKANSNNTGDVIATFTYEDQNEKDSLIFSHSLSPSSDDFVIVDHGAGNESEIIVGATTLVGLEGNKYVLTIDVSDGCTSIQKTVKIRVRKKRTFWKSPAGYAVMAACCAVPLATMLGVGIHLCKKHCRFKTQVRKFKRRQGQLPSLGTV